LHPQLNIIIINSLTQASLGLIKKLLIGIIIVYAIPCYGQIISETQWFFGGSEYNLQFDKNGILVYEESRMAPDFGSGGPAVLCDAITGNLGFYSDGVKIYDGSGEIMFGATDLNGDPSLNQTAVVSPFPNSSDQYLLFTNSSEISAVDELQYAIIDMSAPGNGSTTAPLGEVISSGNSVGLFMPADGMTVVQSASDPNLNWLITQNRGTAIFYVYKITQDGVDTTPISVLDPFNTDIRTFEAANISMNPQFSVLAIAPKTALRNVMLLNFDDINGVLSYNNQVLETGFPDDAEENTYDVEWSNDGTKLYISRYGSQSNLTGNVYQYDLTDSLAFIHSILPDPIYRSYGLKRAIDGRIYHLYQVADNEAYLLNRISNIDSTYDRVSYETAYSDIDFKGTQFPEFAPNNFDDFSSIDFTYLDSCQDLSTKFFPIVDPPANQYFWNFDDGNVSNSIAPIHTYEGANTYNVTLTVELNGRTKTVSKSVQIISEEMEVNLIADTTICQDEILTLDPATEDAISYQWSTGETTSTIDIDTAGIYWVEITGVSGCAKYAESNVTEYGAQVQIQNNWYFGETAGINFTNGPIPIDDDNLMNSLEGCATIDDADGNLLFYTNGKTVWNKEHKIMPFYDSIGSLIGDSTSAQGTLIMPFMDDITMFYIFTTSEVVGTKTNYPMRYAVVDMKKDSARGAVVLNDLPLFNESIEKIATSSFSFNGWLIGHEFGNNSFRANLINNTGIGPTIYTPIGSILEEQEPNHATGYMKFGSGNQLFANGIPGLNDLEIFDFDNENGRFENVRKIETLETSNIYGLEFSGNGSKIYTATSNKIIQYNLDSLEADDALIYITDSKYDGYESAGTYGALQRGPNGIIYVAVDQNSVIGTLSSPNSEGASANFNVSGFDLVGHLSRKGLPAWIQNSGSSLQGPTLSYLDACFGLPTQFAGSGTSILDEFFWVFYDSLSQTDTLYSVNGESVSYEYNNTGLQYFTLNITNRCGYDSLLSDTLEIYSLPEPPEIPESASICNGSLELSAWGEDREDFNYYWSTGETTRTIEVFEATTLFTAIISTQGCSSDTLEIFIGDGRPDIDLGPDIQYCQYATAENLNSYITDLNTQQWSINSESADTTSFQTVYTELAGIFEYVLYAEEAAEFGGCSNADTLIVTIKSGPEVTSIYTAPTNCGENDGVFNLEILSTGSYRYTFSGMGINTFNSVDGPDIVMALGGLSAGIYNYKVTDLITSCTVEDPVLIEDDASFSLSATNLPECEIDANLRLTISGVALPSSVNLYITDIYSDTIYTEQNVYVPLSITPNLDSGFYYVLVEEIGGNGPCIQSDSVLITPLIPGIDDCQPQIFAPNAFSPNGNSQNENFFVYSNLFIDQFEVYIYTRWGQQVYYANDKDFKWDGSFNGKVLGPATYAYIIKFTNIEKPEDGIYTQYGSVTLIK
jgi:gliding motility-associated-like protein